ncbi:MAG: hypothetical protein ABIY70_21900 [Capsulimonas sp.]|uniref:hypothetical protein n=1 Tax=Capsulimonas sp. TaxID=2494211 RepID=UPI00326677EA
MFSVVLFILLLPLFVAGWIFAIWCVRKALFPDRRPHSHQSGPPAPPAGVWPPPPTHPEDPSSQKGQ